MSFTSTATSGASGSQDSFNTMDLFDKVPSVKPRNNHSIVTWASPVMDKYSQMLIDRSKLVILILLSHISLISNYTRTYHHSEVSLNKIRTGAKEGRIPQFLTPFTCPKTNSSTLQTAWNDHHDKYMQALVASLISSKQDENQATLATLKPGGPISEEFMKV